MKEGKRDWKWRRREEGSGAVGDDLRQWPGGGQREGGSNKQRALALSFCLSFLPLAFFLSFFFLSCSPSFLPFF